MKKTPTMAQLRRLGRTKGVKVDSAAGDIKLYWIANNHTIASFWTGFYNNTQAGARELAYAALSALPDAKDKGGKR